MSPLKRAQTEKAIAAFAALAERLDALAGRAPAAGWRGIALTPAVAPDRGMNLAPVQVEHAHRDGARRSINLGHKRDGTRDA